jgi:hypothetical protein
VRATTCSRVKSEGRQFRQTTGGQCRVELFVTFVVDDDIHQTHKRLVLVAQRTVPVIIAGVLHVGHDENDFTLVCSCAERGDIVTVEMLSVDECLRHIAVETDGIRTFDGVTKSVLRVAHRRQHKHEPTCRFKHTRNSFDRHYCLTTPRINGD